MARLLRVERMRTRCEPHHGGGAATDRHAAVADQLFFSSMRLVTGSSPTNSGWPLKRAMRHSPSASRRKSMRQAVTIAGLTVPSCGGRSEEHTSELQSLMRISYAVFCLKTKKHL